MSILYGSTITESTYKGYGRLRVEYSVAHAHPEYVSISGTVYLEAHGVDATSNIISASGVSLTLGNASDITWISKNVSSSGSATCGKSEGISANLGSFEARIAKGTSAKNAALSITGSVTVTCKYSGTTTSASGTSTNHTTINIDALTKYTIRYYSNNGSAYYEDATKYYGISTTIRSNTYTRSGYVFRYWNTNSSGTGTTYQPGASYTTNADLNLYAIWHQNPSLTYTVTSSGTYYQNATAKPYTISVTGWNTSDSASISSIVLTVGSQSASLNLKDMTVSVVPNTIGTFTPTLTFTDSLGGSTTYSLTSITVKANTKPSCSISTTTSGPYYQNATPYTVNITNASAKEGKSISSIVLTVGSKTASRSNDGSLTVYPASTGTNAVSVKITDNVGASETYSMSSISVSANTAPTLSYQVLSSGYYYANASTKPYQVKITNATAYNSKTISSIILTIGSQSTTISGNGTISLVPSTVGSFTPKLTIIDNIGITTQYSLGEITVKANTAPTCTCTVASAGDYYAGWSSRPYKVTITNASAKESKSISSIKLELGSQSTTLTGNGILSITPSTPGTFTPKVTITDNIGASTSYNQPQITVNANTAPTCTCTVSSSAPYYAGAPTSGATSTPYTVTISNLAVTSPKTLSSVSSIKLTVGRDTASRTDNGTLTVYPSTAGSFTPTVVLTDNFGATRTYTLASMTVNALVITVSDVTAQRIIAASGTAGELDDEGTYAVIKVKFTYSKYTNNYLLKPVILINGTQTNSDTWYTGWTSAGGFTGAVNWTNYQPNSGTVLYTKIATTFDINTSYLLSITPKTTAKIGTTITVNLAQAFYLIAGKAGGKALGIGKKPKDDGTLDIGMGEVILNNYGGNPPAISYQGSKAKYKMIRFMDNASDTYGNGVAIGGGGAAIIGGGESSTVMENNVGGGAAEAMWIGNDSNVNVYTNLQNGWDYRKTFTFDTDGDFNVPRYVYAAYLNQSSDTETPSDSSNWMFTNSDGFLRKATRQNLESHIYPYEAKLQWGGQNYAGSFGPLDAGIVDTLGANRFMFAHADGITIEYSRDGGSTWTDYGYTGADKISIFGSGKNWFSIGKADSTNKATANGTNYQLRVTLDTGKAGIYTELRKFAIYLSTYGSNASTVTIQKALENTPTSFVDVATNIGVYGWSGWNIINVPAFTTYGNAATTQYGRIRFIFKANGGNINYNGLQICQIKGFGGVGWTAPSNMAKTGHLYSFDDDQVAYFPSNVRSAYSFISKNSSVSRGTTPGATSYRTLEFHDSSDRRLAQVEHGMLNNGNSVLNLYVLGHYTSADSYGGIQIYKSKDNTGNSVATFNANTGLFTVASIQATNINGVAVGSSPQFTDHITTVTNSGSGNAVTAISASNGALTVTKGSTFLTSHQTVSNKAPTLAWNTTSTVANIGGTDITVKMPANPNTNTVTTLQQIKKENISIEVEANAQAVGQVTYTPTSGYTALGIVGFNQNQGANCIVHRARLNSGVIYYGVRNLSSSKKTVTIYLDILEYKKE